MKLTIKNQLDPLFEILSLLFLCHSDTWKEKMISALDDYGVSGELFYREHLQAFDKYVETFQKHKVQRPEEDALFQSFSEDTFMLIFVLAIEKRSCIDHPENLDLLELRSLLAYFISDTGEHPRLPDIKELPQLPDETSLIDFIDGADVESEEKWYMLNLLRKADYWLASLYKAVEINKDAYAKALAAVEEPLRLQLEQLDSYHAPDFFKIAEACADKPALYPSLAMPLIQMVLYTCGYFGLSIETLIADEASGRLTKDAVIRQVKSISDKSKLDILCALKESPMYNLKLSEHLGLSPSTVSHHTNTLLSCGFVTVEKKDGKVYYCLHRDNISRFISSLEQMLL